MFIFLNNSNLKKILFLNMFILFSFCLVFNYNIVAENTILTMEEAVNYAKNLSEDYKSKKDSKITKKIELTQAIDAVKDARKKESTVRFSLLFDLKMPEKHAMPKEIELLTKVPKLEVEIKNIVKELEDIQLAEKEKVENCFIDVYSYNKKYNLSLEILNDLNERLEKVNVQLKVGKAKQQNKSELEKKAKTQETKVLGLLQSFEKEKEKLSELVGFDVSRNYIFANPIEQVYIDRNYLTQLISYSVNNDFTLNKTKNDEKIARSSLDQIYNIYSQKWGGIVKKIETEVHSDIPVDFDSFLDKYNSLLADIDKPWSGKYTINLLLFKIEIPKEWFKKEYDGLRYFEDQKYAIFVSLKEKEEAVRKTLSVEKELKSKVKDGFENLQQLKRAYENSVNMSQKAKKEYDRVSVANKLGKASYSEVETEKDNFQLAQESEFENLIAYNKQIVSYDRLTCGGITALRQNVDVFLKSAKTGDSVTELEELIGEGSNSGDKIVYYINNAVDQRRIIFGLQIPEKYSKTITHYEVLTPEKMVLAKKTSVDKTISILPIEYRGSTQLVIRLYNNDNFILESSFDGIVSRGVIELNEIDAKETTGDVKNDVSGDQTRTIGNYSIENFAGKIVKKIKLSIPSTQGYSFYKVIDSEGRTVGKKDKYYSLNENFSYIGFVANDLSKLKIQLYDAKYKLISVATFDQTKNELIIQE